MSRDNSNQKQIDKNKLYPFLLRFFFCISFLTVAIVGTFTGKFQVLIWGFGLVFLVCGILGIIYKIPIIIRIFKNQKGKSFRFIDYFNSYLMIFAGLGMLLLMIIYN